MTASWSPGRYELIAAHLQPASDLVVARAAPRPGERVLDVCCGTGNAASVAAAAGAEVDGIDLAERLVDVARDRVPGGRFTVGDAEALPYEDAAFDAAVSVFGAIFAGPAAAAELLRVVKPGGRIVISIWTAYESHLNAGGLVMRAIDQVRPPAPDAPRPTPWWDRTVLDGLFAPHRVDVGDERLAIRADSPQAMADLMFDNQPMWLAAREVLGEARYEQLRTESARYFAAINEARDGTLRFDVDYYVATVGRSYTS